MENYADLMFQGAVTAFQKEHGTFEKYQTAYRHRTRSELGADEIGFVRDRESFYIASSTESGWPYIQHRGGPRGFLRVVGPTQLACADYRGNRQFITMGHVAQDPRVSLFLMDYLNSARLKIQGHARLVPVAQADPALVSLFASDPIPAERVLVIDVVALDWNCPKYIPKLLPEVVVSQVLQSQLAALREENARLTAQLEALQSRT